MIVYLVIWRQLMRSLDGFKNITVSDITVKNVSICVLCVCGLYFCFILYVFVCIACMCMYRLAHGVCVQKYMHIQSHTYTYIHIHTVKNTYESACACMFINLYVVCMCMYVLVSVCIVLMWYVSPCIVCHCVLVCWSFLLLSDFLPWDSFQESVFISNKYAWFLKQIRAQYWSKHQLTSGRLLDMACMGKPVDKSSKLTWFEIKTVFVACAISGENLSNEQT